MANKAWPRVRAEEKNNRRGWVVDARIKGRGDRPWFPYDKKEEAMGLADLLRERRAKEGTNAFDDEELRLFGWTIQKAIDFAVEHLRRRDRSKPVAEAVAALLDFKRDKVAPSRLEDIARRLGKFSAAFDGKPISQIDGDDINGFLSGIKHPATRNDSRKEIVMLWHFAHSKPRQWVSEPLGRGEVPRAKEPEKGRHILTVAEANRLMQASIDDDVRALNAMVLFGGVRREEVEKLDWSAVDFKTNHIHISAEVSKVARERFAPMPPNLRSWLLTIKDRDGRIVQRDLMWPLRYTWKRAKIKWVQDSHRHSFISYRRELVGDAQTAREAGTSETIIKKHYKRPVLKKDALAYSRIKPPK